MINTLNGNLHREHEKTVLLVDDEADIREVLALCLEANGIKAKTAKNGQEALAVLAEDAERREIDLIISDVRMPGMGGHLLLEELRNLGRQVPVVFITGFSGFEEEELISRGAFGILNKPFYPDDLMKIIEEALNSSPAERSAS